MNSPDLLSICGAAFIGVFLLLTVLAIIMRVIIILFPSREAVVDAAVLAAVATAVGTIYPGTKVTKIEEIK